MASTTEHTQAANYATSERHAAGPTTSTIPSYRFSCVYLTSCSQTAELASTLAATAQIQIHRANSLDNAMARLQATKARVILVDVTFEKGNWGDAVRMAAGLPLPVALVLVSRLIDHRLWIDALEGGAYDLIVEPFHADELHYILGNAHLSAITGSFWFGGPRNEPATDHAGKQAASVPTALERERVIDVAPGDEACQLGSTHTGFPIGESSHNMRNSHIFEGPQRFVASPPDHDPRRHRSATQPVGPESSIRRVEYRVETWL